MSSKQPTKIPLKKAADDRNKLHQDHGAVDDPKHAKSLGRDTSAGSKATQGKSTGGTGATGKNKATHDTDTALDPSGAQSGARAHTHLSLPHLRIPRSMSVTNFFNDKKRLIDFCLAYQPGTDTGPKETMHADYRLEFEKQLKQQGLELEYEGLEQSQDGKTCFVKIHAPWEVLARTAEINRVRMPIRINDIPKESRTDAWIRRVFRKNPFVMEDGLQCAEPEYFNAAFSRDRLHQFLIVDKETFFSPVQRIRMVWDIILRTTIRKEEENHSESQNEAVGIKWLLKEDVYVAGFPLHDGDYDDKDEGEQKSAAEWPLRKWLRRSWARTLRWYKYQPLCQIRDYYGEKVGIQFAWLGFYTQMLIFPAVIGTLCFLFGLITHSFDIPHSDVCKDYGNRTICRLCPKSVCPFKPLKSSCLNSTLTYIFDNYATVFFSCFVSIWAVVFLELWKRYQAELSWSWDVFDMEFVEESIRPEYQASVKTRRINPVTQEEEPYLPMRSKIQKIAASFASVIFMAFVVLGILAGIIFYRIVGSGIDYQVQGPGEQKISAPILISITASIINAVCIMILGKLYERLAWFLTTNEYPRTDLDFENSYTYKVFVFQFINYYAALFYIAFIKGKVFGPPNSKGYADRCDPVGCLIDVCIQLAIIMIAKQTINNVMEVVLPALKNWWKRRKNVEETEDNKYTRWEKDFDLLPLPELGFFDEYLEMIIQYGFVTMFVAAFPLAPLFALLNNVIEIRLDAYKITTQLRRPIPARARDIGAWYTILEIITKVAVITNGLVIAFTSDFIDRILYIAVFSEDGSLNGYTKHVYSVFNTSSWSDKTLTADAQGRNVSECWYRDYRYGPGGTSEYERTKTWWHVLVARLFFVLIFEHVVFLIQGVVQYFIPDIPEHVQVKLQRQNFLAKQALYRHEAESADAKAAPDGAPISGNLQPQPTPTVAKSSSRKPSDPAGGAKGAGL